MSGTGLSTVTYVLKVVMGSILTSFIRILINESTFIFYRKGS